MLKAVSLMRINLSVQTVTKEMTKFDDVAEQRGITGVENTDIKCKKKKNRNLRVAARIGTGWE